MLRIRGGGFQSRVLPAPPGGGGPRASPLLPGRGIHPPGGVVREGAFGSPPSPHHHRFASSSPTAIRGCWRRWRWSTLSRPISGAGFTRCKTSSTRSASATARRWSRARKRSTRPIAAGRPSLPFGAGPKRWRGRELKAVACIQSDLEALLAHFQEPPALRTTPRTTHGVGKRETAKKALG